VNRKGHKGQQVTPYVRMIVIPTQAIYKQCIKEGLVDIFTRLGSSVQQPTDLRTPCLGSHMAFSLRASALFHDQP